jgi:hypothetical protein
MAYVNEGLPGPAPLGARVYLGDTQDQLLKMQQEQQKDIEQLQKDVAQLKQQQPQGGETTQPGGNQKGGTTDKAK